MPRATNVSVQNNFTKGLITEATGLTFPENACTDTLNCVFNHIGEVTRRPGIDFETGYESYAASTWNSVTTSYSWTNVAGNGDLVFVVVQIGDLLHFYAANTDAALSAGKHATTIDLTDFAPPGVSSVANLECQFSSGNGLLFVTNRRLNTFYVSYDIATDTFDTEVIDLQIRDFEGDSDGLDVSERPSTNIGGLSAAHRYNLENQGWTASTLGSWDTARTDMPSNADVSWYFKNADNEFDFSTVDDRSVGNSPAPSGHFIYSVYDTSRSSNVAGATDTSIDLERVNTSAFYAGRVFYAGIRQAAYSSRIYFSQIVEDPSQYGKCYQVNDPTSETLFDLLPTDGGVIDIIEAGIIIKMVPVLNTLVVFASNGIWSITGSQGSGFAANDYAVHKISSTKNISHTSFVDVDGIPFWWNLDGIYTINLDSQTNAFRIVSITDQTIRSFMLAIPAESKQFVRGVYDPFTKRIHWIYKSVISTSFDDKYTFDRVLTFNMLSGAFYPWSMGFNLVRIISIVNIFGLSGTFEEETVVDGGDPVVNSGDPVIAFMSVNSGTTSVTKFLTSYWSGTEFRITFSEVYRDTYRDFESYDDTLDIFPELAPGVPYSSYFITGFSVRGQGIRKFQDNYIKMFSKGEQNTSYKISALWDYATSPNTGRWSSSQTFSPNASGYGYNLNRIKIRGHGVACQLKISNNNDKPFHIVGWSAFETGNQWV